MNMLQIEPEYDACYPGTDLLVIVRWNLERSLTLPAKLEFRLAWSTSGKGDRDQKVIQRLSFTADNPNDSRELTLRLPWGPYSFSGKLISLVWTLELDLSPGRDGVRREIIIGPNSQEVLIGAAKPTI